MANNTKHYTLNPMSTESLAIIMILILCGIVLTAANAVVCLGLKLLTKVRFWRAFGWGCLALMVPPIVIAYGALVERNLLEVTCIDIAHEELPADFDGYRVVHISDIHARSFEGREQHLARAVERINALQPDIIAFSGDLITMTPDELCSMQDILCRLEAADGVYSVLGNHDYCMYSHMDCVAKAESLCRLIATEEAMGWTLLMNEHRMHRRGADSIAIVGVENTSPSHHFPSKGDLAKAAEGTEGMYRILLSHDPLHWEAEIVERDFALTLAGHTHAMQFAMFGWSPSRHLFPQYRGLYTTAEDRTQHLYVNTGLGETIFPARIGVRPEITLITLRKAF